MILTLIAHDPTTGKTRLYELNLTTVVERTGVVDPFGRHQVQVRRADGRNFTDRDTGSALVEVLGLDEPAQGGESS